MKAGLSSDLGVEPCSSSLKGRSIDVVVTGSVGATESVKFVRALRRLGADVYVYMTQSAGMFVTPIALCWASSHDVNLEFSGYSSHLARHDLCVIAPATANFISKVVSGICDDVASALVQSYFGYQKPVMFLPAMHDSLYDSCFVNKNIEILSSKAQILSSRESEGKKKFQDPSILASMVSHYYNKILRQQNGSVAESLITMGSTKAYVDEVRYISNYSSGALGSCISEELFRYGVDTIVLCGNSAIKPRFYSELIQAEEFEQFSSEFDSLSKKEWKLAVCLASVLDFIPEHRVQGKIHSSEDFKSISLVKTPKLISKIKSKIKIGFKLESLSDSKDESRSSIVEDYISKYDLDYLILNYIEEVSSTSHKAYLYKKSENEPACKIDSFNSKQQIASFISHLI